MGRPGTVGRWLAAVGALGLAALLGDRGDRPPRRRAPGRPSSWPGAPPPTPDGRGFHEVDPTARATVGDRHAVGPTTGAPDRRRPRARPRRRPGARPTRTRRHQAPDGRPPRPPRPADRAVAPDGDHRRPCSTRCSARSRIRSTTTSTPLPTACPPRRSRRSASPVAAVAAAARALSVSLRRDAGSASGPGWWPRSSCCSSSAEVVSIVVLHQVGTARIDERADRDLVRRRRRPAGPARRAARAVGQPGGPPLATVFDDYLGARPGRGTRPT